MSSPRDLLEVYVELDRRLGRPVANTEAETASAIVSLAVSAVPGAEYASITDRRDGRFRTPVATGDVATSGDRVQYDAGTGPCVDAILGKGVLCTGDIASDSRWPDLGPRVHARSGASSLLSFRLFFDQEPERSVGLNLYSTRRDAFDESAEMVGTVLATHSALALNAAAARDRAANLERALVSNRRIGMAMGVLMASHKVTDDDAFTLLRIASQNANRKLLDVADEVIETGILELPPQSSSRTRSGRGSGPRPAPPADPT